MWLHALKRFATAIPTMLLLVTLTFFLMRLAPGGPFDRERSLPPEIERALAAEYHLRRIARATVPALRRRTRAR